MTRQIVTSVDRSAYSHHIQKIFTEEKVVNLASADSVCVGMGELRGILPSSIQVHFLKRLFNNTRERVISFSLKVEISRQNSFTITVLTYKTFNF